MNECLISNLGMGSVGIFATNSACIQEFTSRFLTEWKPHEMLGNTKEIWNLKGCTFKTTDFNDYAVAVITGQNSNRN